MCKPACCPSNNNGTGLGLAIATLIGLAVISAVARPVIHAAEDILRIGLITISVLAGLAIAAAITALAIRLRRTRRTPARPVTPIRLHPVPETTAPRWRAQEIEPGIWACTDPQRQIVTGMQPDHAKPAALHRKIQAALDAGQQVIIIDGKTRTWS